MIVRISRFALFVAGAVGGFEVSRFIDWTSETGFPEYFVIILFVILGCAIGYLFGGILGRELARAYDSLEDRFRAVATGDLLLGTVGLVAGLLVGLLLGYPFRFVEPRWIAVAAMGLLSILCAYAGVRVAMVKSYDMSRFIGRQLVEEPRGIVSLKVLDTSAVIDGRFADMRRAGALDGRIVVPTFVLDELHTLADSSDDLKRARGRRGLDLLETMKQGKSAVEVFSVDYPETPDVDSKLMQLCETSGASLVTTDFNLTKAARVRGCAVVNLNEVASALRPTVTAGEAMRVAVVREGKEPGQGVGYLEDGTMVVVEGAKDHVGREIQVVVTSIFQASAGRMVFARTEQE